MNAESCCSAYKYIQLRYVIGGTRYANTLRNTYICWWLVQYIFILLSEKLFNTMNCVLQVRFPSFAPGWPRRRQGSETEALLLERSPRRVTAAAAAAAGRRNFHLQQQRRSNGRVERRPDHLFEPAESVCRVESQFGAAVDTVHALYAAVGQPQAQTQERCWSRWRCGAPFRQPAAQTSP